MIPLLRFDVVNLLSFRCSSCTVVFSEASVTADTGFLEVSFLVSRTSLVCSCSGRVVCLPRIMKINSGVSFEHAHIMFYN